MNFNKHFNLDGKHAFLGASKYHWIKYDDEKILASYDSDMAKAKGTELHNIASSLIKNYIKLPRAKKTLNMFVNDAIGFKMESEQVLSYSDICFGTADAICFRNNLLRIHDLKTGVGKTHMEQLIIYAALFCLEYHVKPQDINIELRIYQNNDVWVYAPTADDIVPVMTRIISADKLIRKRMQEG